MSLLDRLQHVGDPPYISAHTFNGIVSLWLLGEWNNATAVARLEQALGGYELTQAEQDAALEIKAAFDALNAAGQGEFLHRFEGATVLYRRGVLSRAEFKLLVGIQTE